MDGPLGDKFADGTRTLKLSRVAEPAIVNSFDILEKDVKNFRGEYEQFKNEQKSVNRNIDTDIAKLTSDVDNTNAKIHTLNNTYETFSHNATLKMDIAIITLYNLLQIWPLRCLNKIFHWWSYNIVNEERATFIDEYYIYVSIIMRGNVRTRGDMRKSDKQLKERINCVKETYRNKGTRINVILKPFYPI